MKQEKPDKGYYIKGFGLYPYRYTAIVILLIVFCAGLCVGCNTREASRDFVPVATFAMQDALSKEENVWQEDMTEYKSVATSGEVKGNILTATSGEAENVTEEVWGPKSVYLTFDDGPSDNTGKVLEILDKYGIKATFFVVGYEDEESTYYYKRIIEEGHTLAIHSYTHDYNIIYTDLDAFSQDVMQMSGLLTGITGVRPVIYRFPGGSSNSVAQMDMQLCKDYLTQEGMIYFDWNVSSGDGSNATTSEAIITNVIDGVRSRENSVVLMHDSAYKENTVQALEIIIQTLLEKGVMFYPITEDTTPVQHR